jgi:hypothetical protein
MTVIRAKSSHCLVCVTGMGFSLKDGVDGEAASASSVLLAASSSTENIFAPLLAYDQIDPVSDSITILFALTIYGVIRERRSSGSLLPTIGLFLRRRIPL